MTLRSILAFVMISIIYITAATAATIEWDPAPASERGRIGAYRVYRGTESRAYDTVTSCPGNQQWQPIWGLTPGTTYYFAATAVDHDGLESDFSDEVVYTPSTNYNPNAVITNKSVEFLLRSSDGNIADTNTWMGTAGTSSTNSPGRYFSFYRVLQTFNFNREASPATLEITAHLEVSGNLSNWIELTSFSYTNKATNNFQFFRPTIVFTDTITSPP